MLKIEKFIKQRNGNYKLKLENSNELIIHEDLILKYELLLSKNIDTNTMEKLLQEQKIYDVYNVVLKYMEQINIVVRKVLN